MGSHINPFGNRWGERGNNGVVDRLEIVLTSFRQQELGKDCHGD